MIPTLARICSKAKSRGIMTSLEASDKVDSQDIWTNRPGANWLFIEQW